MISIVFRVHGFEPVAASGGLVCCYMLFNPAEPTNLVQYIEAVQYIKIAYGWSVLVKDVHG